MKIAIFGASGSVGRYLIDDALERGHEVTAITRSSRRISQSHPRLRVVEAQLTDPAALDVALEGADAAIISLGDDVADTGTVEILAAMSRCGVTRVEALTGFGTSSISRRELPLAMRTTLEAVRLATFHGFTAKERQDAAVRSSGLDFTIVQPPTLTHGPRTDTYRHGDYTGKSIFGTISRADLSAFMLDNLEHHAYSGESVYIES